MAFVPTTFVHSGPVTVTSPAVSFGYQPTVFVPKANNGTVKAQAKPQAKSREKSSDPGGRDLNHQADGHLKCELDGLRQRLERLELQASRCPDLFAGAATAGQLAQRSNAKEQGALVDRMKCQQDTGNAQAIVNLP